MNENPTIWTFWQKAAFRFFFIFFIIFIAVFPIIPWLGRDFYEWYAHPFKLIAEWLGHRFFDLSIVNFDGSGSGDTYGCYLLLAVIAILTLVGTVIWSILDWQRKNYHQLFHWLIIIVRCYVIVTMTVYGFVKIFKTQFPYPSPARLSETFGQSSPMALAWTFFGYSRAYNYFIGVGEFSCALLLFFRRTTLLGAMLTLVISANIMAINYCFDVPAKIFSTALVVMSIFIMAGHARRLLAFFVFNRPLPENVTPQLFAKRWQVKTFTTAKYSLFLIFLSCIVYAGLHIPAEQISTPADALLGDYNVIEMNFKRPTTAKADSAELKWDNVNISADAIDVKLFNQQQLNFQYKRDDSNSKLVLLSATNAKPVGELSYRYIDPNVLFLQGDLNANKIYIKLSLNDWEKSLLIRRQFHWVNEYPYDK